MLVIMEAFTKTACGEFGTMGKNHHILKIFSKLQTNILVCYLIFRLMLETLLII